MKASEALELSKENDFDQIQLDQILENIKSSALKGRTITFWDNPRTKVISNLEKLGYAIGIHSFERGTLSVSIDWSKTEAKN